MARRRFAPSEMSLQAAPVAARKRINSLGVADPSNTAIFDKGTP